MSVIQLEQLWSTSYNPWETTSYPFNTVIFYNAITSSEQAVSLNNSPYKQSAEIVVVNLLAISSFAPIDTITDGSISSLQASTISSGVDNVDNEIISQELLTPNTRLMLGIWDKDFGINTNWDKQQKADTSWSKFDKGLSSWTKQSKPDTDWDYQSGGSIWGKLYNIWDSGKLIWQIKYKQTNWT